MYCDIQYEITACSQIFLDTKLISCKKVFCYLGVLVDSHLNWNDQHKHAVVKAYISSIIVYSIVLVQWSLSHINFFCSLLWNMLVQFGFPTWTNILEHIQLRAACWAAGSGFHPHITWVSSQMIVWKSYNGLLFINFMNKRNSISFPDCLISFIFCLFN